MKRIALIVLVGLILIVVSACSPTAPATESTPPPLEPTEVVPTAVVEPVQPIEETVDIPEITIDAADYSFTAPDPVREGWVRVRLTNSGTEPHHAQFMRLNDGVSLEQFQAALQEGAGPALALVQQMGGVGAIAPAGSAQVVLQMPAGEYVILCFIESPSDHLPHLAKGMVQPFTVQAADGPSAEAPTAALTIRLKDFSFDMPETLPAGHTTIQVVNDGPEAHEWNIMRLAEGMTLADAQQYFAAPEGPPPFLPVGGMNGLSVGLSGFVETDLIPGTYIAICNIPSPANEGHAHATLGMIKEFTVTGSTAAIDFPVGKFVDPEDSFAGFYYYDDGTWAFFEAGSIVVEGTYGVDGNRITITVTGDDTPGCDVPAVYDWSFDGTNLIHSLAGEDNCAPRKATTDGSTWVLSGPAPDR